MIHTILTPKNSHPLTIIWRDPPGPHSGTQTWLWVGVNFWVWEWCESSITPIFYKYWHTPMWHYNLRFKTKTNNPIKLNYFLNICALVQLNKLFKSTIQLFLYMCAYAFVQDSSRIKYKFKLEGRIKLTSHKKSRTML